MYRVSKILNNNGVIAINTEDNQEYVLLGKGIGFGKKVSQRFEVTEDTATYRLTEQTDRGSAKSLVQEMDPEFLEIADEVIREAEKVFGKVDRRIMIPLADHISFAVSRIRNQEQISNPLTDDIRVLFHNEFQAASVLKSSQPRQFQDHLLVISPDFIGCGLGLADSIGLLNRSPLHLGVRMGVDHRSFNLCMAKILGKKYHGHPGLV